MKRENIFKKYHEVLKKCAMLENMDQEHVCSFLKLFHEEKWPKNSCILNSEKIFYHFYIIINGRVKMYQIDPDTGKEITLFLLDKNDFFDIFCLLDGCKHNVYYECLDKVNVIAAPLEKVKLWLTDHPTQHLSFLPYIGKQMRILENYISDFAFTDISTRLIKLLVNNVNSKSNNLEHINNLSNKEIAYLIGSTRAVVNRHLQKLKKNGIIKISRNNLKIQNMNLLLHHLEDRNKDKL